MSGSSFDRDSMASWYASQHFEIDPGTLEIHYLKKDAPEREIRLLEVNNQIAEMTDESLEPLDFGVDIGDANAHKLFVLDVTPSQWDSIQKQRLSLPRGWSMADSELLGKRTS